MEKAEMKIKELEGQLSVREEEEVNKVSNRIDAEEPRIG